MVAGLAQVGAVVSDTPRWVWAVLALLVWRGMQQLRTRDVSPRTVMTAPAVFVVLGLLGFAERGAGADLCWAAAAVPMLLAGAWLAPRGFASGAVPGTVRRPGSAVPLVRSSLVFALQYGTAVWAARSPHGAAAAHEVAGAVSGASFGLFAGWAAVTASRLRQVRAPVAGMAA